MHADHMPPQKVQSRCPKGGVNGAPSWPRQLGGWAERGASASVWYFRVLASREAKLCVGVRCFDRVHFS
jgi:hypothetical protein